MARVSPTRDLLPRVEDNVLPKVLRNAHVTQLLVCSIGWFMLCGLFIIVYAVVPALNNMYYVSVSVFVLAAWIVATFPRLAHVGLNSILTYEDISNNVRSKAAFFRMSLVSIPCIAVGIYVSTYTRYHDIMHLPTVVQLSIVRGIINNFLDLNKLIGRAVIHCASRHN